MGRFRRAFLPGTVLAIGATLIHYVWKLTAFRDSAPNIYILIFILGVFMYGLILWERLKFVKKTANDLHQFNVDFDARKFIEQSELLQKKLWYVENKDLCTISISWGYSRLGELEKAIEIIDNLRLKEQTKLVRAIGYNNLFAYYFLMQKTEEANQIFPLAIESVKKLQNNPHFSALFQSLNAIHAYMNNNYEEAERNFQLVIGNSMATKDAIEEANVYLALIYLKHARYEDARIKIDYCLSQHLNIYTRPLMEKAREELNQIQFV
jgi:tetratricopeptide (TPR) repeat protein